MRTLVGPRKKAVTRKVIMRATVETNFRSSAQRGTESLFFLNEIIPKGMRIAAAIPESRLERTV